MGVVVRPVQPVGVTGSVSVGVQVAGLGDARGRQASRRTTTVGQEDSLLQGRRPFPTIPARDLGLARAWYADKLGLTTDQQEPEALLYQSGGDRLFLLFSSPGAGTAQHQLAARVVEDLAAEVTALRARGVVFEEYDLPGLRTVNGIATTPVGRAAWFKDSEGNVLTMTQLDSDSSRGS